MSHVVPKLPPPNPIRTNIGLQLFSSNSRQLKESKSTGCLDNESEDLIHLTDTKSQSQPSINNSISSILDEFDPLCGNSPSNSYSPIIEDKTPSPIRQFDNVEYIEAYDDSDDDKCDGYAEISSENSHYENIDLDLTEEKLFQKELHRIVFEEDHHPGYVISCGRIVHQYESNELATFLVSYKLSTEPIKLQCSINTPVFVFLQQAICTILPQGNYNEESHLLKLQGKISYLNTKSRLIDINDIKTCYQLGETIKLDLVEIDDVDTSLSSIVAKDDVEDSRLYEYFSSYVKKNIDQVFQIYYQKLEYIKKDNSKSARLQLRQSVRAVLTFAYAIETSGLRNALNKLDSPMFNDFNSITKELDYAIQLNAAHLDVPFNENSASNISQNDSNLFVNFIGLHKIPAAWESMKRPRFRIRCSIIQNNEVIGVCSPAYEPFSFPKKQNSLVFQVPLEIHFALLTNSQAFHLLSFCELPLDSILSVEISALFDSNNEFQLMAWVNFPLFDAKRCLHQQLVVLPMWTCSKESRCCTLPPLKSTQEVPLLHLEIGCNVAKTVSVFPPVQHSSDITMVSPQHRKTLDGILEIPPFQRLTSEESELLWCVRTSRHPSPYILIRIIESVKIGWNWAMDSQFHQILQSYKSSINLHHCMELLSERIQISSVRDFAVGCLLDFKLDDGEIADILPQLVQTIKWQQHHFSSLVIFLLKRAYSSVNLTVLLFWYFEVEKNSNFYEERFNLLQSILMMLAGRKLSEQLILQRRLVETLNTISQYPEKNLSEQLADLNREVFTDSIRLPIDPAVAATSINTNESKRFKSKSKPLHLFIHSNQDRAKLHQFIYKVGDDIRQDALMIQLIKTMDQMWLAKGLDLKIITFFCLPTGKQSGFIEVVEGAQTLRQIQEFQGVTGPFRSKSIVNWLEKTSSSLDSALDVFLRSCAGYCVATYLLGICDRHNDNIMLKPTGHLFHIDFGRILGNSEMFFNYRRDHSPFAFSGDMKFAIERGKADSKYFQEFVELCCQAYNIIRSNYRYFVSLCSIMISADLPELNKESDVEFFIEKLALDKSETEATSHFTKIIFESMEGKIYTETNFFVHALVNNVTSITKTKEDLLPGNVYRLEDEGEIFSVRFKGFQEVEVYGKHIIFFNMKVYRANKVSHPLYLEYTRFTELEERLRKKYPRLTCTMFQLPKDNKIKSNEEKEKHLIKFCHQLFSKDFPEDVRTDPLVYTLFHSKKRNDASSTNFQRLYLSHPNVQGKLKLGIQIKENGLSLNVIFGRDFCLNSKQIPNSYVKIQLLPDPTKMFKYKTKVFYQNANPIFDQNFFFSLQKCELLTKVLSCTVWDKRQFTEKRLIGYCHISVGNLPEQSEEWYNIFFNT